MSNKKTIKCVMDTADAGGLTVGKEYEVLAEYKGMYSIVNDYDWLEVYSEIFFTKDQDPTIKLLIFKY